MRLSPFLVALMLLPACLAGPVFAQAVDWTYTDADPARGDFYGAVAVPDASGVTVLGNTYFHTTLARYGNDGALASLRNAYFGAYRSSLDPIEAVALADGGVGALLRTYGPIENPLCFAARFDAASGLRWQRQASPLQLPCSIIGADAGGALWVRGGNTLERHAADGALVASVQLDGAGFGAPFAGAVAADGTAYVATNSGNGGVPVIAAYDTHGSATTLWTGSDAALHFERVALGTDGNLYAIGSDANSVRAASFTPAGALRWQQAIPAGAAPQLVATAAGADGRVYALDRRAWLYAILNSGEIIFQAALGAAPCGIGECRLAISANGDALALFAQPLTQLTRQNFRTHATVSTGFPGLRVSGPGIAPMPDGGALVGPLGALSADAPDSTFIRVDESGNASASLPHEAVVDADMLPHAVAQTDDGTTYVFSAPRFLPLTPAYLSRVSPQGRLQWKQPLADGFRFSALQADAQRVCYLRGGSEVHLTLLECRAAADGGALFTTPLPSYVTTMKLLADESIAALGEGEYLVNATHYLVDAQGGVAHAIDVGLDVRNSLDVFAYGDNGTVVVSRLEFLPHRVYAWDRNGNLLYALLPPADGDANRNGPVVVAGDGSAVVAATLAAAGDRHEYVWGISAGGQLRWSRQADARVTQLSLSKSGDAVHALSSDPHDDSLQLFTLGLADGVLISGGPLADSTGLPAAASIAGDRATGLLLAKYLDLSRVTQIAVIDPDLHRVLRQIALDCGDGCDYNDGEVHAALSSDGTLRVVGASADANLGARWRIDAVAQATYASDVRIAQAGLDGAWFAPYESGQGFAFDYIASGNTVFMPWFTFASATAYNEPSGLAWYTLQGTPAPGASSVELTIGSTDPGAFASAAVGAHAVGTALLSFSDCNSGLLLYQFSGGERYPSSGAIVLKRLTPSTSPCVLANGAPAAAQIANGPANGFDARQSGSWFDPATGGQGLQITIIPAGGGFNGLVFAPWFTFDPAGAADDAAHQHWFSLQGDLATASAGRVELALLRTIGGGFDSAATGNSVRVGHATLTLLGCDRARLDYAFDSSEVAHAFAGINGSENLVKLGACSPP